MSLIVTGVGFGLISSVVVVWMVSFLFNKVGGFMLVGKVSVEL